MWALCWLCFPSYSFHRLRRFGYRICTARWGPASVEQRMIEENSHIFNQREAVLPIICYSRIFLYQPVLWHVTARLTPEPPRPPHYTSETHFCIHTHTHCSEAGIMDLSALILWALVWFSVTVFLLAPSFQNIFPNLLLCSCKYTAASKGHLSEYML